jgi:Mg-chelatase subunit ChlD
LAHQSFLGLPDGTFRIFPGRHNCSDYDPTERPWYVAASSGPKNIMLVLDTSGSMGTPTNLKLDLLKKAAKRVVNTLTVRDRIGIVRFSDNATSISPNGRMLIAN